MAAANKQSAGILLFHFNKNEIEFFLVHPGGPFWSKKDEGAWSIPKGEFTDNEAPLAAAKREFFEETGFNISGNFIELGAIKQKSGKKVLAWALESYIEAENVKSNFFEMEWPPRSGKKASFPEVDKAAWFTTGQALAKIIPAQQEFITRLLKAI